MKQLLRIATLSVIAFTFTVVTGCAQSGDGNEADANENQAEVVLAEYSDFQCPACAYFYPMVEKLKEEYGDRLAVEYNYFPLNSHQYAALAARAAEAAKNQGQFDAMHDLLFENQKSWSNSANPQSVFIGYAKDLDLDMQQFRDDLNAAETQKAVMEQKQEGINLGVNSTPTFFVNGDKIQQLPRTYEQFKGIIEEHLSAGSASN